MTYDNSLVLMDGELARPAGFFLTSDVRRRWSVVYKIT
ncbi:Uncharacterised protein [Corynebacterium striatum]|nr:Uncharacterised protein [Corynebacterium striatum]